MPPCDFRQRIVDFSPPHSTTPQDNPIKEQAMRYLSMIRIEEKGQVPTEKLMNDMGKLLEEMTREGTLVTTAGLRPTKEGKRVRLRKGQLTTTDGPFVETKEVIGGFAVLEAKSMNHALELTNRFLAVHGDEWDLVCEVREMECP